MKRLSFITSTVLALVVAVTPAGAQTITGRVTSAADGEELPGVNVTARGTLIGTTTGIDGTYSLDVPQGTTALLFSFVGFRSQEVPLSPGQVVVNAQLEDDVLGLDEVVVTGLATTVKRSNVANSVGTISSRELVPAPAQTLERALSGKVPGLTMSQNTGAPGGGINVNLRGSSTITGSTQPLYVVDGVIYDNTAIQSGLDLITAATGAGSATPQGQPSNRIADINPNDIENIEVLKGASAAAIYGSKATNGVVIITTKRGTPGKTRIDITQQIGATQILNKLGTRPFTAETAEARQPGGAALLAQNGVIDYEDEFYGRTGFLSETSVGISGGDANTRFFVGGLAQVEDGIVTNTGYDKYGAKVNLDQMLFNDRLQLSVNTSFTRSESDRSITGNENQGSTTLGFAFAFTPPFVDIRQLPDGTYPAGPAGSNPLHSIDVLRNNELVNRGVGSVRAQWGAYRRANQTVDFIVTGGADIYAAEHQVVSPPELQFEQAKDPAVRGKSVAGETTSTSTNLGVHGVHRYSTTSAITNTFSGGYQYETRNWNNVLIEAEGIVTTQSNIDQAAAINGFQDRRIQRERGFFVQDEIDFKDKVFVNGGFRADASSSNGDTDKYFFYPKAAGSIRLSQFDFWNVEWWDELKVRLAFGRTGNLPPPDAKFTSLQAENVSGLGGVIIPTRLGNAGIEPETTQEIEVGFDASMFDDRASLEFSYYTQDISDLILQNQLPSSSGFQTQFINAGDMTTEGIEIGLAVNPFNQGALRWTSRLNFFKTWSEITSLSVDPFEIGGFALSLGQFQIQEGVAPTTIVGLNEAGAKTVFGDETPEFQLGWVNDVSYNNFNFTMLWDLKKGGDVVNLGLFLTDLGGTSADLDSAEGKARAAGVGGTGRYVEDGTYIKLRETSLSYNFDRAMVQEWFNGHVRSLSIGVAGRNLLMFTDYSGYDPEVSQFGNLAIGRSIDVIPFPSARSYYFKVSVGL